MYESPAGNLVPDEFEPELIELRQDDDVHAARNQRSDRFNECNLVYPLLCLPRIERRGSAAQVHERNAYARYLIPWVPLRRC